MTELSPLEKFNTLTTKQVNELYTELKKCTKKVNSRVFLENGIRDTVKNISIIKHHIGMPMKDTDKKLSGINVTELRNIHRTMRECLHNARTKQQKMQRIARLIQVCDYFLDY